MTTDLATPAPPATVEALSPRDAARIRVNALVLLPAAVITFVAVLAAAGAPMLWPILIGAAGWMIALILRQPVALIAGRRLSQEATARMVGWFSGPAEEIVRFVLVLLTVHAVQEAAWFGWGWATVEILILAVNLLALSTLLTKDDQKSREARELLAAQGGLQTTGAVWGFIERLSASALHIGFTLMLFAQPWLVLVTLPLHSVINMLAVKYGKKNIVLTEVVLAVAGVAALAAGILLLA